MFSDLTATGIWQPSSHRRAELVLGTADSLFVHLLLLLIWPRTALDLNESFMNEMVADWWP